jgi:methoxymalonate biosynthesis acyl carrier protein
LGEGQSQMEIEIIRKTLIDHIKQMFQVEEDDEDFTPDVHLFDYGYIDSFGATELISFIENQFGIEVTQKDLMLHTLNTVNEITELIRMKTEEQ